MDFLKIVEVIRIAVPVFALIGIGKMLSRRGIMTRQHRLFLNGLAYYLALPALIYAELSIQPFQTLTNPALILGTIAAIALLAALYTVIAFIAGFKKGLAAAVIFGTFWANVTYMGFPLAAGAFGETSGLAMAAVVNAFAMPSFVITGFLLIGFYTKSGQKDFGHTIASALGNPVVIAALLGLITAFIFSKLHLTDGTRTVPVLLLEAGRGIRAFLKLTGTMGLPIALLSVGGSLSLTAMGKHKLPLAFAVTGKLVIMPAITLLLIRHFFPSTPREASGVAVLLMATPLAVASYVVSSKLQVEESFVSSLLALSTIFSIVTIPVWLYFLL